MSVPPELMKLMAGGGAKPGAPSGMPPAAAGNAAPAGGPMSTPQPKEGLTQAAMIDISMVAKLLTKSMAAFGELSPEGKAINDALRIIIKAFGADMNKSDSLIPAELMQLVQSIPGAGGGPPGAGAVQGIPPAQPAVPSPAA